MKRILLSLLMLTVLLAGCNKDDDISSRQELINGYVAVDLGLPSGLKWATCNVGASSSVDYGKYYCWAKVNDKIYTYANYTKGIDYDFSGNPDYDVAANKWGASWRTPTSGEMLELIKFCEWSWTAIDGVSGYKVVGTNGNYIFLPAAGYRYEEEYFSKGKDVCYTTSTPNGSYVYSLWMDCEDSIELGSWQGCYGRSVRPVSN